MAPEINTSLAKPRSFKSGFGQSPRAMRGIRFGSACFCTAPQMKAGAL